MRSTGATRRRTRNLTRDGRGWPERLERKPADTETECGRGAPRRRVHGGREPGSVPTWIHRAGVLPAGRLSPEADAQRGEEEEITEENVYDAYDETMPFFPDQILIEGFLCVLLLLIVTALSYLAPAPLTEPADTATITYVPRPEWFFFFYEQMLMFFPGYA